MDLLFSIIILNANYVYDFSNIKHKNMTYLICFFTFLL